MNLAFTDSFSVDTNEILIQRGSSAGNGVIPHEIIVRAISIVPSKEDNEYPSYYIKGIHSDSNWVEMESGTPVFVLEGLDDSTTMFFYVRSASGTITLNLFIKGKV